MVEVVEVGSSRRKKKADYKEHSTKQIEGKREWILRLNKVHGYNNALLS